MAPSSGRAWAWASSERITAAAALGGVFAIAALAYWWTRAPLYNLAGSIDPWLYTALFVNFDTIYEHFSDTYYAARLPWVVPGRIAHGVLPAEAAFWTLHGLSFVGGVVALYVLVRRYLGLGAAVVGAATLALSTLYWSGQSWDYLDGITVTYLLAGLCFGLPLASGRLRTASFVASGVFFAAAVTTNLFVALVALSYPILYVCLQDATGPRARALTLARDAAALAVGAAALVLAMGLYAVAHGGPFLYFEPQIDFIRTGADAFKLPDYEWVRAEPRLLVPPFLVVVAAPLLLLGRRLPPFRFAAGSVGGLAFVATSIYLLEFFAGGSALEEPYYFSYFTISIALTTASVAALAVSLCRADAAWRAGVAAAAILAAVAALGIIYRADRLDWVGRTGMKISVVAICGAVIAVLAFVLFHRTRIGPPAAVVATCAVAFACHLAINSSYTVSTLSISRPENGSLYRAALDQVRFVENATPADDSLPRYWYSSQDPNLTSIQSMYYYGFTYLDLGLPKITSVLRERLDLYEPETIVMLCETRDCGGGAKRLRRAGYPFAEFRAQRTDHGAVRFWTVVLRRLPGA